MLVSTSEFDVPNKPKDAASSSVDARVAQLEAENAILKWQVALWSRKMAKEQQKKGEPYGIPKKVGLHTWLA